GMPDASCEFDLRRGEWIVGGDVDVESEDSSLVGTIGRSSDRSAKLRQLLIQKFDCDARILFVLSADHLATLSGQTHEGDIGHD
ncbi:hypothetical protein PMAYCL1PPCAC_11725, partial [Pristionchus mayeri]